MEEKLIRYECHSDSYAPVNHSQIRWLEWNNEDYLLMRDLRQNISGIDFTPEHWKEAEVDGYKFCAYIVDGKILSLACAIMWSKDCASWEVGANQTREEARNKGYEEKVLSFAAKFILDNEKIATFHAYESETDWQAAAKSVGFFENGVD